MIAALLARLGLSGLSGLARAYARPLIYLVASLAILASLWLVAGWYDRQITKAEAGRDAIWTAKIEAANREIAQRQAERMLAAAQMSARLADETARAETLQSELEKANAALPNGDDCGIDRNRARLLR